MPPHGRPMQVQLYLYDLSGGLLRLFSQGLLGRQIDAMYHTSIVIEGIEYVYDGGVKQMEPARSHLGSPLRIIELGKTHISMHAIQKYVESLKEIYGGRTYDMWNHNCNNFTNDVSTFLLGYGIPKYIQILPQQVLETPRGRAWKSDFDRFVAWRQRTTGGLVGMESKAPKKQLQHASVVRIPQTILEMTDLLKEAQRSCAVAFFTSDKCTPCKKLLPVFDELATEADHRAILMVVDVTTSFDIGKKFQVSTTPTYITFLRGIEASRSSGTDPEILKGTVRMLIQMCDAGFRKTRGGNRGANRGTNRGGHRGGNRGGKKHRG